MRFLIPQLLATLTSGYILYRLLPIFGIIEMDSSLLLIIFIIAPMFLFIRSLLTSILFITTSEEILSGFIKEIKLKVVYDEDSCPCYTYFLYLQDDERKFNLTYLKGSKKIYENHNIHQHINIKYKKILNSYIVTEMSYS